MDNRDTANLILYRFLDDIDTAFDVFKPDLDSPYIKYLLKKINHAKSDLERVGYESQY